MREVLKRRWKRHKTYPDTYRGGRRACGRRALLDCLPRITLYLQCRYHRIFSQNHHSASERFGFLHSIEDSLDPHHVPIALIDGSFASFEFHKGSRDDLPLGPTNTVIAAVNPSFP